MLGRLHRPYQDGSLFHGSEIWMGGDVGFGMFSPSAVGYLQTLTSPSCLLVPALHSVQPAASDVPAPASSTVGGIAQNNGFGWMMELEEEEEELKPLL